MAESKRLSLDISWSTLLKVIAAAALVAFLVLYLLIEAGQTYRWVRGFMPAALRSR